MKRGLKILVGVVVALVLVIVVALAGVLLFFNPNDYKSQINAAIRSEIGRPVTIQGQIRLSVFPWLGIKLGRVSVANAEGFGDQPLATMQSAGVGVRLLPLLGRHIDIGTVSLNGLQVHLARDAQGKTNWGGIVSHLSGGSGATVASSSRPTKKSGQVSGLDLNSLQIQKVDVQNAAVYWSDATTGADYRLTGVHAQTGLLADGKPVQLKVGGHLAVPGKAMQVALEAAARVAPNLSNQDYRFSKLNMTLDATGASIPGNRQQVKLTATGDINLHAGSFEVADLSLQAAGLDVRGQLKGSGLNGHLRYGGQLTAAQFDPRKVMQGLQIKPPATRKQDALSSAAFDTGFQGSADKIEFKPVVARLDGSTLKGTASVQSLNHPEYDFDLSLDHLNVDDYRPPAGEASAGSGMPARSGGPAAKPAAIDLTPLKGLRLNGQLTIGSLVAANMRLQNARVVIKARDGVLNIEPLTAGLYKGQLQMSARIDATRAQPRYAVKGGVSGVQIAPLLKDVAGSDRLSAKADMNINLTTAGARALAMKRSLNGSIAFDLKNGAFNGFNLARIIATARSRLGGAGAAASSATGTAVGDTTPFNTLSGHLKSSDGVLSGNDLKLDAKAVDATGSGRYDLVKNALDYTVKARVPKDSTGTLSALAGLTVPIHLTGSLWSPHYNLDVASAVRDAASQRLKKEGSKLQDKLQKKLKSGSGGDLGNTIQQGLSNFLGGSRQKKNSDTTH